MSEEENDLMSYMSFYFTIIQALRAGGVLTVNSLVVLMRKKKECEKDLSAKLLDLLSATDIQRRDGM